MDERQLQKHFLAEAEELIESLLADVERLGASGDVGRPSPALVNRIFRNVHSLKGLSGMANVPVVHRVSHALEDLLEEVRMGRTRVDAALVEALATTVDELPAFVRAAAGGAASDRDAERMVAHLQHIRGGAPAKPILDHELVAIDPALLATLTEYEEHRLHENVRDRRPVYELRVAFQLAAFDQGFRGLSEQLAAAGEIIGTLPGVASDDPMKIAFRILYASAAPAGEICQLLDVHGGELEQLSHYDRDVAAPGAESGAISTSIRVDMEVFDELSLMADSLSNQVAGLGAICASMARQLSLAPREIFELRQQRRAIERAFADLQERIVDARLVPLGPTLIRSRRLVEKLAAQLGRDVDFVAEGEDVRLDKTIVDRIAEPLAHLIGNALDHGLEPPAEREAAGKPARGTVRLSAESSGNRIALHISDDGRGVDVASVRRAAAALGLESATASRSDPLDLIFAAGVSTAPSVTDVSGRGVGLDAVAAVIGELGGEIRVVSETGRGTTFTIELPTTLVTLSAFLVEAAGWTYAVDVNQLVELGIVEDGAVDPNGPSVAWRDGALPFFTLSGLVRAAGDQGHPGNRIPCLIARSGNSRTAIAVDRFVGERDVIVKSLGRHAPALRGVSGAIDLEDSGVALLVDLSELIEEYRLISRPPA